MGAQRGPQSAHCRARASEQDGAGGLWTLLSGLTQQRPPPQPRAAALLCPTPPAQAVTSRASECVFVHGTRVCEGPVLLLGRGPWSGGPGQWTHAWSMGSAAGAASVSKTSGACRLGWVGTGGAPVDGCDWPPGPLVEPLQPRGGPGCGQDCPPCRPLVRTGVQGRPLCAGGCEGGGAGLTRLGGPTPRPGLRGRRAQDGVGSSFPGSTLSAQASDLSSWPLGGEWVERARAPPLAVTREAHPWWAMREAVGAQADGGYLGAAASARPCLRGTVQLPPRAGEQVPFPQRPRRPGSVSLALSFSARASGQRPSRATSEL